MKIVPVAVFFEKGRDMATKIISAAFVFICAAAATASETAPPASRPATASAPADVAELEVGDFSFTGSMGCPGAKIEKLGRNHFRVAAGRVDPKLMPRVVSNPTKDRNLMDRVIGLTILRHAKGNDLRLDGIGTTKVFAWSYDEMEWHGVKAENYSLKFPVFEQDRVTIGPQICFPHETLMKKIDIWKKNPAVSVVILGQSIQKRDIPRIVITDPNSPNPAQKRWSHLFMNQHPTENNARWRMVGMIQWLLGDDPAAKDFLQRSICHFELMITPDGPANGWTRTNAEGMDMNRCYRLKGADANEQTHEAYIVQKDIETLMASDCPLTSVWGLHTDNNAQLKITIIKGPEGDNDKMLGPWKGLPEAIKRADKLDLLKPPNLSGPVEAKATYWNAAVNLQFGITNVLVEGGQDFDSAEKNMAAGEAIIRGVAEFYKGVKP